MSTLWVEELGAGDAVVLLHGTVAHGSHAFATQLPLAERWRLLLFELVHGWYPSNELSAQPPKVLSTFGAQRTFRYASSSRSPQNSPRIEPRARKGPKGMPIFLAAAP